LAPLAKSFSKYQKGNETYRTGQYDAIIFSENAIHNNTIKQYLEIAAISPRCLIGPIMLQITVEYFNFSNHKHSIERFR